MSAGSIAAREGLRKAARRQEEPAPLLAWLRAVALAQLAIMAVLAALAFAPPLSLPSAARGQAELIADFARELRGLSADRTARPVLVLLGTSRLNYAVGRDRERWRSAAAEAGIPEPHLLSLPVAWGSFQRFVPLLDDLARLPAGLLVLQSELLTEDFTLTGRLRIALRYLAWKSGQVSGDWALWDPVWELETFHCPGRIAAKARLAEARTWIESDPSAPGPRAAGAFLKRMQAAGWRIAVANLPKAGALERLSPSLSPALRQARAGLADAGLSVLHYQEALPDRLFCDAAHLAPEGGKLWLRWLFAALAPELRAAR